MIKKNAIFKPDSLENRYLTLIFRMQTPNSFIHTVFGCEKSIGATFNGVDSCKLMYLKKSPKNNIFDIIFDYLENFNKQIYSKFKQRNSKNNNNSNFIEILLDLYFFVTNLFGDELKICLATSG